MHADELVALERRRPDAGKSPFAPRVCASWAEAREIFQLLGLVRIVDVEQKHQLFVPLSPMTGCEDYQLEGITLITPAPADGYTPEERAAILREYDAGPYIPRR